jgi:hypothetical protein
MNAVGALLTWPGAPGAPGYCGTQVGARSGGAWGWGGGQGRWGGVGWGGVGRGGVGWGGVWGLWREQAKGSRAPCCRPGAAAGAKPGAAPPRAPTPHRAAALAPPPQLLRAPLTRARLARVSGWVDAVARGLLIPHIGVAPHWAAGAGADAAAAAGGGGEAEAQRACRRALFFGHMVLAFLFPIALCTLRYCRQRPSSAAARAAAAAAARRRGGAAAAAAAIDEAAAGALEGLAATPGSAFLLLLAGVTLLWELASALARAPAAGGG